MPWRGLIELLSLVRPMVGTAALQRAMRPVICIIALSVLAMLLIAAMLGIALWALHGYLLANGVAPLTALLLLFGIVGALLLAVIYAIACKAKAISIPQPSVADKARNVLHAFMDGFNRPDPRE